VEPISKKPEKTEKSKKKSGDSHEEEVRLVLRELEIPEDAPVARAWIDLTGRSREGALHRRAHRSSLSLPRPADAAFETFWENTLSVLDAVLAQLELKFSQYQRLMDEMVAKESPTSSDIDALRKSIPNSLVTGLYFFHRLKGAGWLRPLREIGAFREIPPIVRSEEGISCPPWPAADFLKRCVATDPQEVAQVLREAPETDNWRAVSDLADLACVVLPDAAAEWSERIATWIHSQESLSFGVARRLGGLAANLARRGKANAGLQLAAALLEIRPDRSEEEPEESPFRNLREPSARFDLWEYEEILRQDVPDLVDAAGVEALALLIQVLDNAILLSDRRGEERRPEDLSHIWRPAIEEHSQNLLAARPKSLLVAAVRDAAERTIRNSPSSLRSIVAALENKGSSWKIFNRLALHLVRIFGEGDIELVKERLLDRGYFDSADMRHEYALLAKEHFGRLDVKHQK